MSTFAMFKALLLQQWKHQRVEITALSIAAAVVCPFSLWLDVGFDPRTQPWRLIDTGIPIAVAGSLAAVFTGALLAIRPYVLDTATRHTYAMALPVPRAQYALLRAGAGLALSLVPVTAFLIGAVIAAQMAPPAGLVRAYPAQIALRFLLGIVLAFALGFGVQYGLGRRAVRWIMIAGFTIGGMEIAGQFLFHASVTAPFWLLLAHDGSPFRVLVSEWTLFNV